MKIINIITRINELKPNNYSTSTKLDWINHVDGSVWNDIYKYTATATLIKDTGLYELPANVSWSDILHVYIDGEEIFETIKPETTGYLRDSSGKLKVYPETDDTVSIVHRQPFIEHGDINENAFMPSPYDKAYDLYISAMIDYFNKEYESYNNGLILYNDAFKEFAAWWEKNNRQSRREA